MTQSTAGRAGDLEGFLRDWVAPHRVAMASGEGPQGSEVLAAAGRHGLAGLLVPPQWGGAGATHVEFAQMVEAVARVCASTSVILDVHVSVACEPLLRYGTAEQRDRYLPLLASGEWLGAFALTEPQGGSDVNSMSTAAHRQGDEYVISGTKTFISNAGSARLFLVTARTSEGSRGLSCFLVEAGTPGLSLGTPFAKMGLHGSWTGEVVLDHVTVPVAARLGEEGMGARIALGALDSGRVGISAQATGIAAGAVDDAVRALRGRDDADETALADMGARVMASRCLTLDAAAQVDQGQPVTYLASIAKLYTTDSAVANADMAVALCAPDSAQDSHAAAIRFRDAKACQIYEGTNQIQRMVIARQLLRASA